jgi:hypothetical protein
MTHEQGTIALDYGDGTGDSNLTDADIGTGTDTGTDGSGAGGDLPCVHMDGSAVYGATTDNGWLRFMHRWACPLSSAAGGNYLLVDAMAVKPNRGSLFKYGSLYVLLIEQRLCRAAFVSSRVCSQQGLFRAGFVC